MKSNMALAALLAFGTTTIASATTFVVNKTGDDGSAHTLRWAIEQNNLNPSSNRIQIIPTGPVLPFVIKLNSLLPPIMGPATIEGKNRGSAAIAPLVTDVVIDGSNFINGDDVASCPGANPAQSGPNVRSFTKPALSVVDSGNVEISGLEIRHFCIGILALRSHDNRFHHNKIHNMAGAAGIEFTGDDGNGGPTTGLSTRNVMDYNIIYDTGDGAEFTRGTSYSVAQYNLFFETRAHGNVPYSQGIEFAGTLNDHNKVLHNTFAGYSDGLQMNAANDLLIMGNTITSGTYGITASGTGVVIVDNVITGNRMGVGPSLTSHVAITQNQIYNNGQPILSLAGSAGGTTNPASPARLGIDVGVNGVTPNDLGGSCADTFPDCDTVQNFPVLSPGSSWSSTQIVLQGALASRPNAIFVIEFYANHGVNVAGFAEGERYLASLTVASDPTGNAAFAFTVPIGDPLQDGSAQAVFTATATNASGSTSEFSAGLPLSKQ